nr:AP endonuclease, family 2 [Raoultella sp. NCTC 9187]
MQPTAQPTLQLKVFRTLWGVTTPWQQTLSELKSVGCCGIEARVPPSSDERQTLARRLQESELEYIAILFSGGRRDPGAGRDAGSTSGALKKPLC